MSDSQAAWMAIWKHVVRSANPKEPFEISEVAPEVARTLNISEARATSLIGNLLGELSRMPDGRQFFRREGNAIVPLPEFSEVPHETRAALAAYPYEL